MQAAIAQEKAAEEKRRPKSSGAAAAAGRRPSSTGSSRGPPSPASRAAPPLGSFGFSAPLGGSSSRLSNIMSKAFDDSLGGSDGDSSDGGLGSIAPTVAPISAMAQNNFTGKVKHSVETSDEFDF